MGFSWSPGWTLLLAAVGLFFFIFGVWAIHTYFRGKKPDPIKSEQPQSFWQRPDPLLRHSLYSCPKMDITNPRDSTHSLILNDGRYSAPPPAYSRPPSFMSSTIHPRESSLSLSSLRQSIHGDDLSIFESPRNSTATSLVPTRISSPASSRRPSMQNSVYRDSGPSLAALRHSIYGDSNPIFTSPKSSSMSLPLPRPRPASLSPTRLRPRDSSDFASIRGRQPSGSLTDLRQSLYSDASPVCAHPENPGITPFIPRSRTSSPFNVGIANNRYSCPDFFPSERSSSLLSTSIPSPRLDAVISIPHMRSRSRSRPNSPIERDFSPARIQEFYHIARTETSSANSSTSSTSALNHIARPKTSNTRFSSQTVADLESRPRGRTSSVTHSSLSVEPAANFAWSKTSNTQPSMPLLALKPEDIGRPKTSNAWALAVESDWLEEPTAAHSPSITAPQSENSSQLEASNAWSFSVASDWPLQTSMSDEPIIRPLVFSKPSYTVPFPVYTPSQFPRRVSKPVEADAFPDVQSAKRPSTLRIVRAASIESIGQIDKEEFGYLSQYFSTDA